jgi:hypothetical protein
MASGMACLKPVFTFGNAFGSCLVVWLELASIAYTMSYNNLVQVEGEVTITTHHSVLDKHVW